MYKCGEFLHSIKPCTYFFLLMFEVSENLESKEGSANIRLGRPLTVPSKPPRPHRPNLTLPNPFVPSSLKYLHALISVVGTKLTVPKRRQSELSH